VRLLEYKRDDWPIRSLQPAKLLTFDEARPIAVNVAKLSQFTNLTGAPVFCVIFRRT
jgi:hypothetical protein